MKVQIVHNQEILDFVERFAADLIDSGFPRMPARVFAALLAADSGRLTAAELTARLRVSQAAVSGAVQYLSQVALITRETEPGTRRDRYRVREDAWQEAIVRRDHALGRWVASLSDGIGAVGPGSPAGARLAEMIEFIKFLQIEMPALLQRWREHRGG